MSKYVLALGGNALGDTPTEQLEMVKDAAKAVVALAKDGHKVIICHGNGPQVGMINNSFSTAQKVGANKFTMPFAECGAMSQGYIGYHLQNAINNEIAAQGLKGKHVATIVSQVLVDANDKAFDNPTKYVGGFMTEEEAHAQAKANNWTVKEDSGRGWRRVVPSPKPLDIVEKEAINALLDANFIVVAGGGGGIPVYEKGKKLVGIDAVIDKDWTSAKIAEVTKADGFIILTAVPKVAINFAKPNQQSIDVATVSEMKKHIEDKQFPAGSMLPKVEAAINFVNTTGKDAFIGLLQESLLIVSGKSGTKVVKG